jgi:FixJ family two-component response regulator
MIREATNVFLVDDDAVQLLFLGAILRTAGHRIEPFEQPEALLSRLTPADRGCVVLDLQMPGLNGLELQRALFDHGVALPLVFVSGSADMRAAVSAMKQGAVDFLSKPVDPRELCVVVARALRQDEELTPERAERDVARSRWAELSPREREVCRLYARGLLNKQIAATLGSVESTVQVQRARAMQKLQVSSLPEVMRVISQAGDES